MWKFVLIACIIVIDVIGSVGTGYYLAQKDYFWPPAFCYFNAVSIIVILGMVLKYMSDFKVYR